MWEETHRLLGEAFSTLEVDNAVEFFGVEKNVVKVHLYYLVSPIVALCVTLVILLVTEFIYFRTFGTLIFGRTSYSGNDLERKWLYHSWNSPVWKERFSRYGGYKDHANETVADVLLCHMGLS